jgi:hypothetical protein
VHAAAVGAPLQGASLVEPGDCATPWRGGNSIFWSFIIFSSVAIVFCVSVSQLVIKQNFAIFMAFHS